MRFLFFSFLFLFGLSLTGHSATWLLQPGPKREVRAVWLTTIGGLDWPQGYAGTARSRDGQQRQLCRILDRLQATGINTVLLQTRIRSTVIYPSAIEPWDGCLSGTPGKSPGYDALQFAIQECHKRGMELHAWVVCMPICSNLLCKQLGSKALPRRHPELCRSTGEGWMMDPGVPGTARYLARLCAEITEKYDIDGIHLDYIRYPEKEISFNDLSTYRHYGAGKNKAVWRRDNINRCVREIHQTVKALKPWVKISASPVGKYSDLPLQSSYGWNARDAVSQDAQEWLRCGWMDWLFPMMYFQGKHFYPFALDWQQSAYGRCVIPGLGIYFLDKKQKDWKLEVIVRELNFCRAIGLNGQAYFRSRFLTDNTKGIEDYLRTFSYRTQALPPALTWHDSISPSAPRNAVADIRAGRIRLSWNEAYDPTPGTVLRYNLYRSPQWPVDTNDPQNLFRTGIYETETTLFDPLATTRGMHYALCAMDRYGNEGPAVQFSSRPQSVTAATLSEEELLKRLSERSEKRFLLFDATDREVKEIANPSEDVLSSLAPGLYKVRTERHSGKNGHTVGVFLKRP